MKATDFIAPFGDDLQIKDGDFVVGESDTQHKQDILIAYPGDFKQSPIVGVGIYKRLNSPGGSANRNYLKSEITFQLTLDNYKVRQVQVSGDGKIFIDAAR